MSGRDRLPWDVERVLIALAVAGAATPYTLSRLTGLRVGDVIGGLDYLVGAELVLEVDGGEWVAAQPAAARYLLRGELS